MLPRHMGPRLLDSSLGRPPPRRWTCCTAPIDGQAGAGAGCAIPQQP